jgi:formylglycine-generating enzyme required for sulfatase activity
LLADGIPDIEWLPVAPGGKLVIEDHNDKKHTFKVAPFYIARYPVTYAQYEAFVKAEDGYNNPEWWQNFPEEYRPQQLSEQNMKSWNNPRDKISWYQAVAYTRWLNRRLKGRRFPDSGNPGGGEWVIGQGIEVRLPTEWEWQWAAQGGEEQRKYPWGEWQEGYANTSEAGMNRAIGVGLYPQGVAKCGALDMSGQLLEWCMNKYDKPGEVRADVSGESRVLRGGSFYFVQAYASCGARYDNFPYFDLSYYGFRVVVGAALSRLSEL